MEKEQEGNKCVRSVRVRWNKDLLVVPVINQDHLIMSDSYAAEKPA